MPAPAAQSHVGRLFGIGFLYWLVFLLVLEPGNALRFAQAGQPFPFVHEITRIFGASLLGMAATPFLIPLHAERSAKSAAQRLPRIGLFIAGNAGVALGMILASCVLAAWWFQRQLLPSLEDIGIALTANLSLVSFAVFAFAVIPGWRQERRRASKTTPEKLAVREGRDTRLVDPDAIVWIESKGNQIVIHERNRSHLTRRPLSEFMDELDASAFVRIHRRLVVALREVSSLSALPNGDAEVCLSDGRLLRVSRRNRRVFKEAWAQFRSSRSESQRL